MTDASAKILFQSFLQEALVSSSGMGWDVYPLMLSVRVSAKKSVCNAYLSPSQDVNLLDLEHLVHQLPAPFVVTGDSDAQSSLRGDLRQDSKDQMLENDYNIFAF